MIEDWKKDRIGSAIRGQNPMVLTQMRSGFAVIGDTQFLAGYCVLLPLQHVDSLNDFTYKQRSEYLLDMSLLGDAINQAVQPWRINYSIYGNTDKFLHAHVFPRYDWESEERRLKPVWLYSKEMWTEPEYSYSDGKHGDIRTDITQHLVQLMKQAY